MKVGDEYLTQGGWKVVVYECEGSKENSPLYETDSYWLVRHFNPAFENKSQGWKDWFNWENGLSIWHEKDGKCRKHNGCLAGEKERDYDLKEFIGFDDKVLGILEEERAARKLWMDNLPKQNNS